MSYYNNYVNQSYRTTQVSPKYSMDISGKLKTGKASPNLEQGFNSYGRTVQSNKNEGSQMRSQQALSSANQPKEFKLGPLKSRESSNAQSMQGNNQIQIDFRYNSNDNPSLPTGLSRQAAHEPLGIAQTLNLNSLQKTTQQSSPSKYALVMSKQKKIGGTMTSTKQSPSPIMGRQQIAQTKTRTSQNKLESTGKGQQKLVLKTNDPSKKTAAQPVKKVIKRALIDIRQNQPGEQKKQTRINEAKIAKIASQTGSRNRGAVIPSRPQMQLLEQQPIAHGRNMSKTPLSRISNNLPSRMDDTSNRSNNSQMRGEDSHSRGNSQYDRINMIYNKYMQENHSKGRSSKTGEKASTLSPNKQLKQSSQIKKQPLAIQKQPQPIGANKLSKTLKQQEIRALKTQSGLQNQNVQDRRTNSRVQVNVRANNQLINSETSPGKMGQAQTTSKKKMVGDSKLNARVSLFTVTSNGTQDIQSQTKRETELNPTQISQHMKQVNQGHSPETTKAVTTIPAQRLEKQQKDLGLPFQMQEEENAQNNKKHEQIKMDLPLAEDFYQNQLLYNKLEKKCVTQRERPDSRRKKQKLHNQMLEHQHNRREIIKPRNRDSNSIRSLSQSSKNADVKHRLKQKGLGNDSMASSKRVTKDDKNASNQRSRSTQLNRTHLNNLPFKNGNKNEMQKHSLDVKNKQNQKRIPSLSHSSTSSHAMTSNGDDLCILQNQNPMNKTQTIGSGKGCDVRSHKINMVNSKTNEGEQVSIMNNSPSKFSLNKMSVGSSRNLRYQQQEEDFLDDQLDKNNNQNGAGNFNNHLASSKNDGDVFNYDVDKSKEDLPAARSNAEKQATEPEMKIEVISTMVISNKKEKPSKKEKKKLLDKKGSIVQNNEVFNKAFDLIKTAEQMEENNYKKAGPGSGSGSAENRGSNSLSSNDSLIQTQRKLKQEYAVRLSQQNIDLGKIKSQNGPDQDIAGEVLKQTDSEQEQKQQQRTGSKMSNANNPFDAQDTSDIPKKQIRTQSSSNQKDSQNNFMDQKSGLKQKLVKRARISLIDNQGQGNPTYTPNKDNVIHNLKGASGNKKLKKGLKFPIHEFISASSDQEEDLIIEKYSQVLRSQEKVLEKKNRDSIISAKGSKNFRNTEDNKNLQYGLTQKVDLKNQGGTQQALKPLKSMRDNSGTDRLLMDRNETLPQITEKQSNVTSSIQDSKLMSVPRFKNTADRRDNGSAGRKILSETTFDSQIYMSNDEKERDIQALNNRNLQSNMSIKNTQASSKDRNYQSKLSNIQNNVDISSQQNDQQDGISKSQQIKLSNNLVKEVSNQANTQKRTDHGSGAVYPMKDITDDQVKKVYTESINPFQTDKKSCPYIEKNRSPDSFVRISMNEDNGVPLYDRISHVSHRSSKFSYISQKESIVEPSGAKQEQNEGEKLFRQKSSKKSLRNSQNESGLIKEIQPADQNKDHQQNEQHDFQSALNQSNQDKQADQGRASDSKHKAREKQGSDQPARSQNIEINIEKILQIQKVLQKINKNFRVFTINYGIKTLRLFNNQENYEFESDNNEMIQNVIQYCEDWWNIIREPQVSTLLIKCQRILSNQHIQVNLKKSFIYQLIFFTITGYLMSCAQYQFHKQLKIISERCYFNFLLLCKILVEKFPQETLHKNVWANQLSQIFENNNEFNEEMAQLEKECLAKQRESLLSQKQQQRTPLQFSREVKYRYLRNNNTMIFESLTTISRESSMISQLREKDLQTNEIELSDLHQIYSHQLFKELSHCLSSVNEKEQNSDLNDCIERFGKALREDYNEDSPSKSVGNSQNSSDDGYVDPKLMQTNNTVMSQEKDLQDQLQQSLRVQVDQGHRLIKPPYLPPLNTLDGKRKYTLVLDLDETLLHFEELNDNEGQLSIRPGADSFLKLMSTHFEIVIFTAGTEEYADWALEFMENVSCISHRLYRQHALPFKGYYVKDLSRIGRQLTKTIIVDNIAENFALQPGNGVLIKTWISDPKDTSLFELAPLLLKVVESQTEDVRELLKFYQQQNSELMHSIAYGSKDQLNTLSNQMTIAQDQQDQQAENYAEYPDGALTQIKEDEKEGDDESRIHSHQKDNETKSNQEKSSPTPKEQLQNSVDARQRKLKASVGNSYLSQSSSEAATPSQQ